MNIPATGSYGYLTVGTVTNVVVSCFSFPLCSWVSLKILYVTLSTQSNSSRVYLN